MRKSSFSPLESSFLVEVSLDNQRFVALIGTRVATDSRGGILGRAMRKADGEVLVLTTLDHEEKAGTFAQALVDARLAACVTRLPAGVSMYRWKTAGITVEREHVLLIKTHRDKLAELEEFFKREHPYEIPELLVFSADSVSEAYGKWMRSEMNLK